MNKEIVYEILLILFLFFFSFLILSFVLAQETSSEEYREYSSTSPPTSSEEKKSEDKKQEEDLGDIGFELLGFSSDDCVFEDFTTYTEVDPGSDISVAENTITLTGVVRNSESYVYKDFAAGYFNEIDANFEILLDSVNGLYGESGLGFSNAVSSFHSWSDGAWVDIEERGGVVWIWLGRGNYTAYDWWTGAEDDTLYYCNLHRALSSDDFTLKIYSNDADREAETNVLDTLIVSGYGTSTTYRYVYGHSVEGSYNASEFTGYIENLCLITEQETPSSSTSTLYISEFEFSLLLFFGLIIMILTFSLFISKSVIY